MSVQFIACLVVQASFQEVHIRAHGASTGLLHLKLMTEANPDELLDYKIWGGYGTDRLRYMVAVGTILLLMEENRKKIFKERFGSKSEAYVAIYGEVYAVTVINSDELEVLCTNPAIVSDYQVRQNASMVVSSFLQCLRKSPTWSMLKYSVVTPVTKRSFRQVYSEPSSILFNLDVWIPLRQLADGNSLNVLIIFLCHLLFFQCHSRH